MDTKRIVPWILALVFAVLASAQVLPAAGSRKSREIQPGSDPTTVAKWQYKFMTLPYEAPDQAANMYPYACNTLGVQGWEMVAILPAQSVTTSNSKGGSMVSHPDNIVIFKMPL